MARVHHFDATSLCPILLTNRMGPHPELSPNAMCCHCMVIETADGLLLVDTGMFGKTDVDGPCRVPRAARFTLGAQPKPLATARGNLEKMGFSARDVRHVIVTHLDLDHAGGLADFPDATVHVYAPEKDAAFARRTLVERERYLPAQWAHGPKWKTHATGGDTWKGFASVRPIEGLGVDVAIVPLVGHTRGHAGVAVETGAGYLLHAGDAYFHAREVHRGELAPPLLELYQDVVALDADARRSNRERLRSLARSETDVTIFCAHSRAELRRAQG